jgi:peptidyl-prolyl cis-trans isomerase SurA
MKPGIPVVFRLVTLLALSGVSAVRAQAAVDTSNVDRIAAVVGSTPILRSQVMEEMYSRQRDGRDSVPDPEHDQPAFARTLRRYVDTLVAFELEYREAEADTSIKVTDQEVNDAVDAQVQSVRKTFKTDDEFRSALKDGLQFNSIEDWRASLFDKQRKVLMVHRFQGKLSDDGKIKPIMPTEKEMRAFYKEKPAFFGNNPPMVSMRQIIVAPHPSDSAKLRARQLIDSLAVALRAGADFATLAKRFSMDEQTKADGGNLPWYRRGEGLDRNFEKALFSLERGTISDPVESSFGYHLIQVQRVAPGEVQARHILIMAGIDSTEGQAAHRLADSIHAALLRGESFDSLQHLYHDRNAEELELTDVPMTTLESTPAGKPYLAPIQGVDSGKYSPVFEMPVAGAPNRSKWAVVQIIRRLPAGPTPYEDIREGIRRLLSNALGQQDYIAQLRQRTYVDIREP